MKSADISGIKIRNICKTKLISLERTVQTRTLRDLNLTRVTKLDVCEG
jgi:hypothetical protein